MIAYGDVAPMTRKDKIIWAWLVVAAVLFGLLTVGVAALLDSKVNGNSYAALDISQAYVNQNSNLFVDDIVSHIVTEHPDLMNVSDSHLNAHVSSNAQWDFLRASHVTGRRFYEVEAQVFVVSNASLAKETGGGFGAYVPYRFVIDMQDESVAHYELTSDSLVKEDTVSKVKVVGIDLSESADNR